MRRWQAPKNIKSLGRLALFPSGGQPLQKTTAVGGGYNRACLTRRKQRGQGSVPGGTPKQLVLDCPGRDQTRHVGFIPSRIKNSRTGVKRWTIPNTALPRSNGAAKAPRRRDHKVVSCGSTRQS